MKDNKHMTINYASYLPNIIKKNETRLFFVHFFQLYLIHKAIAMLNFTFYKIVTLRMSPSHLITKQQLQLVCDFIVNLLIKNAWGYS